MFDEQAKRQQRHHSSRAAEARHRSRPRDLVAGEPQRHPAVRLHDAAELRARDRQGAIPRSPTSTSPTKRAPSWRTPTRAERQAASPTRWPRSCSAAKDAVTKEVTTPAGKQYVFSRPVLARTARARAPSCSPTRCKMLDDDAEEDGRRQGARVPGGLDSHRARRAVLRAHRHRARDLPGPAISRPIKMLAWRADQIARGDLETRVEITSGDEIGMLGENFNFMADRLLILLRETAEKATLEKELEVARTIQETLVPPPDPVERAVRQPRRLLPAGVAVRRRLVDGARHARRAHPGRHRRRHRPRRAVGDDHRRGQGGVRRRARHRGRRAHGDAPARDHEPRDLRERQAPVRDDLLRVDRRPEAQTITYANAGHNFPYLFRPGAGDGNEFRSLMSAATASAISRSRRYAEKTAAAHRHDVLVWYTDGIVECENERGEEYGEKRFRAAIRRAAELDPVEMRESVVSAAGQFFGDRPRKDDITMVFARIAS